MLSCCINDSFLMLLRRLYSTLLALPQDSQRPLTTSNHCYKSHTQWALKHQGGLLPCLFPLLHFLLWPSQTFSHSKWNIHPTHSSFLQTPYPSRSKSPFALQRVSVTHCPGSCFWGGGVGWVVSRPFLKRAISESLMSTKAVSKLINNCQARGKAESCMAILKAHQRVRAKSRVEERCGWPLKRTHAHIHKSHMHLTNITCIQSRHWDESISKLQTTMTYKWSWIHCELLCESLDGGNDIFGARWFWSQILISQNEAKIQTQRLEWRKWYS